MTICTICLGTDHLTCRGGEGGNYVFLFRLEQFFRTAQELEYLFFLSRKAQKYFFQQHWESEYFFRKKKT